MSGLLDYLCNHQLCLYLCTLVSNSILVTTPQYQPPTKVCVANRLISEKMISCIFLILFVLAFFFLFADQFLRFCPFNLSKEIGPSQEGASSTERDKKVSQSRRSDWTPSPLDTGANPRSLSLSQIERRKLSKKPLIYRHKRYKPIIDSTLRMTERTERDRERSL